MSDQLGFNKIAGAALATGLAIFGLGELANIIWEYHPPAKQGYAIDISAEESSAPVAVADVPPDWGTVLPKADVSAGSQVAQKCQSCHNFQQNGPNMTGPGLYGVVGRSIGSHPGYDYDQPMKDFAGKNPIWTYDLLYTYLKSPGTIVPGTKMTFVGLPSPADRINIIAYLHSLGSTLPVPAPHPVAAAAASSAPAKGAPAAGAAAAASSAPAAAASSAPAKAG
ncbi:MAG TPA: cytochrome c family protein [Caulobacteraceae bacterium]|nr:cytochrome c family protein [Caulobacteraceae bacterium]